MMLTRSLNLILICSAIRVLGRTVELSEAWGTIESPLFPAPYSDNENVTWKIGVESGYAVELYFTDFDMESSYDEDQGGACAYDYVQLSHDGVTSKFCGNGKDFYNDAPRTFHRYRSDDNSMNVKFVSDYSNSEPRPIGFRAHYVKIDRDECEEQRQQVLSMEEDWDLYLYCNHHCINIPGSYYCACRPGYILDENEHTCKVDCTEAQTLTADWGVISSDNYPKSYSKLADCQWNIEVRAGLSIWLQFDPTFDIEEHYNYSSCPYDRLKLITINGEGEQERIFCGSEPPFAGQIEETFSRKVVLKFQTDLAVEQRGFRVTYNTTKQKCAKNPAVPSNGKITSNNSKGFYEFEDSVTFECDVGYNLEGNDIITCQNDGTWTELEPICSIKVCGDATEISKQLHVKLQYSNNSSRNYGDTLNVTCHRWYEMTGGVSMWECGPDAIWIPMEDSVIPADNQQMPVCTPECGEKNPEINPPRIQPHISDGEPADPNEFPWAVFIQFGSANIRTYSKLCAGFLIHPRYVATAAHCTTIFTNGVFTNQTRNPSTVHAWLGGHDRRKQSGGFRHVSVSEISAHPEWFIRDWDSDYSLLRLNESITMTRKIRPICLPETEHDYQRLVLGESKGVLVGWGETEDTSASNVLMKGKVFSRNSTLCLEHLREDLGGLGTFTLTKNMFCGGERGGSSAAVSCAGDSGSAFMLKDKQTKKYYAQGIVSFGIKADDNDDFGCGRKSSTYSVYSKINKEAADWMRKEMKRMG